MDKKAVGILTGERLALNFYSILALAIVFGAFYGLFALQHRTFTQHMQASMKDTTADAYFVTSLRQPVQWSNVSITLADLAVYSYYQDNYDQLLAVMKSDILSHALQAPLTNVGGWNFKLVKMPGSIALAHADTYVVALIQPLQVLKYQLPLAEPGQYLQLEFSLVCQDIACERYSYGQ